MEKNERTIQSVDRAIGIMKCFEKHDTLGVTEISRMMGLHKSTAFNLIATLEHAGLLERDIHTGKYRLGVEVFRLGTMVNVNLRKICRPYLERLVRQYAETVNLVARSGDSVIYLEKIESPHSMRIATQEGARLPAYSTAVGKAILSTLDEEELEHVLGQVPLTAFTDQTITEPGRLSEELLEVRRRGYALDLQEYETGLTCVAVPIKDYRGRADYAISVSGPSSRMTGKVCRDIGATLVSYADELSHSLGY